MRSFFVGIREGRTYRRKFDYQREAHGGVPVSGSERAPVRPSFFIKKTKVSLLQGTNKKLLFMRSFFVGIREGRTSRGKFDYQREAHGGVPVSGSERAPVRPSFFIKKTKVSLLQGTNKKLLFMRSFFVEFVEAWYKKTELEAPSFSLTNVLISRTSNIS
jgi:hypothetical protein